MKNEEWKKALSLIAVSNLRCIGKSVFAYSSFSGNRYSFEITAQEKCVITDSGNACGYDYACKAVAPPKCFITDSGNACGYGYACKAFTPVKRAMPDKGNVCGYVYTGKSSQIQKIGGCLPLLLVLNTYPVRN